MYLDLYRIWRFDRCEEVRQAKSTIIFGCLATTIAVEDVQLMWKLVMLLSDARVTRIT